MSLFSFIFFPRKVDMEHFNSLITETGVYRLNDLKRYDFMDQKLLEKYSSLLYKTSFDGAHILEQDGLSFKGGFSNKICYMLDGSFLYKPEKIKNIRNQISDENSNYCPSELYLNIFLDSKLSHNQLYLIIDRNISKGEFVEIYSEWLDGEWKYIWGPPVKTIELNLDDILSEQNFSFYHNERTKFIIYK